MKLEVTLLPAFKKFFNKALKSYPKSCEEIEKGLIESLKNNPVQGDNYPGFGQSLSIRKIRIAIRQYKISKRNGLRLIYLHLLEKKLILPLVIYKKNQYKAEKEIKAIVLVQLKSILRDLEGY